MRIRILTHEFPPFRGGVATYVRGLADGASRAGFDVSVWAPDYGEPNDAGTTSESLRVQRFRGGKFGRGALVPTLWRLWRCHRERGDYDVLHCADWPHVAAASVINRWIDLPFMATAHGTEVVALRSAQLSRALRAQRAFHAAMRITTHSEFVRQLVQRECAGIEWERTRLAPLGVRTFWFDAVADPRATLDALHIPTDKRILLTVARLDERKGHRTVLEALERLPEDVSADLAYVIVGAPHDKAYTREIQQRASSCRVPVVLAGVVTDDQLRDLYAAADLLCMPGEPHPTRVEGFGLVYLEAAAQGAPSLAYALSAVPEVVLDGVTGVLTPPGDVARYTDALAELLRSPRRLRELGDAARTRAREFTWERCATLTYGDLRRG